MTHLRRRTREHPPEAKRQGSLQNDLSLTRRGGPSGSVNRAGLGRFRGRGPTDSTPSQAWSSPESDGPREATSQDQTPTQDSNPGRTNRRRRLSPGRKTRGPRTADTVRKTQHDGLSRQTASSPTLCVRGREVWTSRTRVCVAQTSRVAPARAPERCNPSVYPHQLAEEDRVKAQDSRTDTRSLSQRRPKGGRPQCLTPRHKPRTLVVLSSSSPE